VTTFVLLAPLVRTPWLALPGALIALTVSAQTMSGVEGGVRVGMVAARLGWALLPLLVATLLRWMDAAVPRVPVAAAGLLAAIVLCHPAHAPAAVLYLVIAALLGAGQVGRRLAQTVLLVLLAGALTAFWSLPMLWRLAESRPLAWGDPASILLVRSLRSGPFMGVLVVSALGALFARRDRPALLLTVFVPAMAIVVGLDRSSFLPANRLVDSVVLGLVLAAGLGIGRVLASLEERAMQVAVLGILLALGATDARTLMTWPIAGQWPALPEVSERVRLPELWRALAGAPPGRVLFLRSGAPLDPSPPGQRLSHPWYRPHTHVTALTPLHTGRSIVNGTFTHPSPVAGLLYSGSPGREPIRQLVEQLDGERLFGAPLAAIAPETLERFLDLFGASAVVVLEEDAGRFPALEENPRFTHVDAWPHRVYQGRGPETVPEQVGPGHWRVVPVPGPDGDWSATRMSFSPLWSAVVHGARVPSRRGPLGDLQVKAPGAGRVDLFYRAGLPEWLGLAMSAAAVLLGASVWAFRIRPGGRS
jgi:hypothetical protein